MFPLAVAEAVQYLRGIQLPLSVERAAVFLSSLRRKVELIGLYQHFFGEEFNNSTAGLVSGNGKSLSDREIEFLRLVNEKLFPIYDVDELLYDCDDEDYRRCFQSIPVFPPNDDWGENFENWDLGWQMLLILESSVLEDIDGELVASNSEVLSWAIALTENLPSTSVEQLAEHCSGLSSPLTYLPTAIAEIQRTTGNLWIDCVFEYEHTVADHEWTLENVQGLADLWREAEQIRSNNRALSEWIKANPREHFQQVVELWNFCQEN